jgi:hypothetical protein
MGICLKLRPRPMSATLVYFRLCMSGSRQALRPASSRNICSSSSAARSTSATSCTLTSQGQNDTVVIVSPPRRRKQTKESSASIVKKKDTEVWDLPDNEIIGLSCIPHMNAPFLICSVDAAVKSWKSPVYSHYNVTL